MANESLSLACSKAYKDDSGRLKQKLIIDGRILNTIRREDTYWTLEEMGGVNVCMLTITRPSMLRKRHDPILHRQTEEERIEPQTWDSLLVEERPKGEVTDRVFFDLSCDGEAAGRLEFGLFGKVLPQTVENFKALVTGRYITEDGKEAESVFRYKGIAFEKVLPEFIMSMGNAGWDTECFHLSAEEISEYSKHFEDFKSSPKAIGPIKRTWCIRWGGDLGNPEIEAQIKKDGGSVDGNSNVELAMITERLRELDAKGQGADLYFFKPEWEKGVGADGFTFPAEGFPCSHSKAYMLSMDRQEDKDIQGSSFFITLKEFPEMDKRWVCFGELLEGEDLVRRIETEYESRPGQVVVEDCGLLE